MSDITGEYSLDEIKDLKSKMDKKIADAKIEQFNIDRPLIKAFMEKHRIIRIDDQEKVTNLLEQFLAFIDE